MTRRPITNVAASVRDRLLDRSRQTGEDFQFLLQRCAAERLLYRLGQSAHRDRFVLKGAMLFALWCGSIYRPTRDLDFTGYGSSEADDVISTFKDICAVSVPDDGLAFDASTVTAEQIRDEAEYGGLRVRLRATLGSARIEMQVDIEKRTALITHAITKGLDPNVPMMDSGVTWLREIPAHWEAKRLKHIVPGITVGIVVTPAKYYVDEGIPCLRSLNIAQGYISMADLVFISPAANELHQKSQIFEGDLVIVRTGRAGTAVVVPRELSGANCIDLLIIRRSEHLNSRFLYYFINSRATSAQVEAHSVGAIQEHYNTSTLANLYIPKIPLHEQEVIAKYLDEETTRIDKLMTRISEAIDRLNEFRTALISAAVTGKIDVREEAA